MLRTRLIVICCAALLTGCSREISQVGRAAENVRVDTERMIDAADAKSNARQAEIFAKAAQMESADTGRQGPRYEARKYGAGDNWMIYDTRTGAPARVGNEVMAGMTRAQASASLSHMEDESDVVFRK